MNNAESILEAINNLIQTIIKESDVTLNRIGVLQSREGNIAEVKIGEDTYSCLIPKSVENYIYDGDILLISILPKENSRFVLGVINRGEGASVFHIYDTVTDSIISTSLSLIDSTTNEVINTSLEIFDTTI